MTTTIDLTSDSDYFNCVFESLYPADRDRHQIILSDGRIITRSTENQRYNFFDYHDALCANTIYDRLQIPHIIFTGIGNLTHLESTFYDKQLVDYLNDKGLYIFLWEIVSICRNKTARLEIQNNPDLEFLTSTMDCESVEQFYSFELNSIDTFVKNNSLTNVSVFTCEYETSKIFQTAYKDFKIFSSNNMLTCYRPITDTKHFFSSDILEKKFLFLSLRYEVHRHLLAAYIIGSNSIITWKENHREWHTSQPLNLDYLDNELLFDLYAWSISNPDTFLKIKNDNDALSKINRIKLESEKDTDVNCGMSVKLPLDEISKCFCYVIAESTFQRPMPNISEKTINSILTDRPFILASAPHSLSYFKKLGFRTFDQWWDESYDQEEDHEKRILKIFEVIDFIDSHDLSKLKKIYDDMRDVFDHNRKTLENLKNDLMIFR